MSRKSKLSIQTQGYIASPTCTLHDIADGGRAFCSCVMPSGVRGLHDENGIGENTASVRKGERAAGVRLGGCRYDGGFITSVGRSGSVCSHKGKSTYRSVATHGHSAIMHTTC